MDTRQSARVFSLRQDTIDRLPKGRDFTTLVSQAPGVNQEPKLGGISIDGSSASENRFVINGIETTDLITGLSGHNVLPEFVDEIQVKSSGYTAEYGGSTGGVINVVTKSGTNTWRGDVLVNFEGDALDGGPRQTLRRVPDGLDSSRVRDLPGRYVQARRARRRHRRSAQTRPRLVIRRLSAGTDPHRANRHLLVR